MSWDAVLAARAQKWADHIKGTMVHGDLAGVGQNLWASFSTGAIDTSKCVDGWYSEIKSTPGGAGAQKVFSMTTGHYTQVVWKGTTKVGCGQWCGPVNGMTGCTVVCDYAPPGNMAGAFAANVHPTSKAMAQCQASAPSLMEGVAVNTQSSNSGGSDASVGQMQFTMLGVASVVGFIAGAVVASFVSKRVILGRRAGLRAQLLDESEA